jgi:Endomembrane protein 70
MQMYFDDLPVWGFIGKVEKIDKSMKDHRFSFYLFTHFHFDVQYNNNRIIGIDSSADPKTVRDISFDGPQEIQFTYSVKWKPTTEKVLDLPG